MVVRLPKNALFWFSSIDVSDSRMSSGPSLTFTTAIVNADVIDLPLESVERISML